MKSTIAYTALGVLVWSLSGAASAKVSCEEVSAQIEAKIKAKGVKDFTLTVIPKDEVTDLRVVGTCDGGKKKIVYKRG